jgi:Na+-transporting NADH:ubiquinone oxidoreductase subunit NqrC
MKRTIFCVLWILLAGSQAYAGNEQTIDPGQETTQLSTEEQQMLEVLELLQNYDFLEEIEVLSTMEKGQ